MIVKVQRSLSTNADCSQVLVYNEDRSIFFQGDLTPEIAAQFEGGEVKFFAHAKVKNQQVVLESRARWQEW